MENFEIIPVIDILNSKAVHAIKGERSKYKKLKSYLFTSADPFQIIKTLNKTFQFSTYYIADLDSIINKAPNIEILKKIFDNFTRISIIFDPGIENRNEIQNFSQFSNIQLILGLETINGLDIISEAINILGKEKVILSLDMFKGKIISKNHMIKKYHPLEIIKICENWGISKVILLDLFRVGQKIGGIPFLYHQINETFTGKTLVGGGIKNIEDIKNYKKNNFSGVLIATALYDKSIEIEEIYRVID
jgi:phosphoribosylformimino-5-aminoimidazole carboxamide ribotide isomerase